MQHRRPDRVGSPWIVLLLLASCSYVPSIPEQLRAAVTERKDARPSAEALAANYMLAPLAKFTRIHTGAALDVELDDRWHPEGEVREATAIDIRATLDRSTLQGGYFVLGLSLKDKELSPGQVLRVEPIEDLVLTFEGGDDYGAAVVRPWDGNVVHTFCQWHGRELEWFVADSPGGPMKRYTTMNTTQRQVRFAAAFSIHYFEGATVYLQAVFGSGAGVVVSDTWRLDL